MRLRLQLRLRLLLLLLLLLLLTMLPRGYRWIRSVHICQSLHVCSPAVT